MNTADLRTKGYEISVNWRDGFVLCNRRFNYSLGFTLSDYRSHITKYDNKDKVFSKKYYEGMRLGEIWGFTVDGLFATDEEAAKYSSETDLSYVAKRLGPDGKWKAGDLKFADIDGDGKITIGDTRTIIRETARYWAIHSQACNTAFLLRLHTPDSTRVCFFRAPAITIGIPTDIQCHSGALLQKHNSPISSGIS